MAGTRIIADQDGRKWKVMPRGAFAHLNGKELVAAKQKAADYERSKGRESIARAYEEMLWIEWALRITAMYSWKERVE